MFVELSFPSTNFQDYLTFRQNNDRLESEGILGASVPKPKPRGGKLVIVDWEKKEIVWETEAPTPAGFVFENEKYRVCDELGDQVVTINSRGDVCSFISHPFFNYLHDIDRLNDRFLVTSTGVDAILEFSRSGKLLFEWHAVLHGYTKTPTGITREIDFDADHRGIRYATLDRTAHINSAAYFDDFGERILTTFFHRGQLVSIDKLTGDYQVIYDGLDHPHAIHRGIDGGFIFSETGVNKVHVLDESLKPVKSFDNIHGCEWIQDSIFNPSGNILIGDANKARIIEVSYPDFMLLDVFEYDHNWKLFKVGWNETEELSRFVNSNL